MIELKQKQIKQQLHCSNGPEEVWRRLREYQKEHNTTGMPSAYHLNLRVLGYSYGTYGVNGMMWQDITTGEIYCSPTRDNLVYLWN